MRCVRRAVKTVLLTMSMLILLRVIIIPLPYGADTDWCLNVMKSGGCTLTLNGQTYELTSPEIVTADLAEPFLPIANARLWHWMGMKQYLVMQIAEPAPSDGAAHPNAVSRIDLAVTAGSESGNGPS